MADNGLKFFAFIGVLAIIIVIFGVAFILFNEQFTAPPIVPNPVGLAAVTIDSNPIGAEIFMDGFFTTETTPNKIIIAQGFHTIILRKEGYNDFVHTFTINAGEELEQVHDLTRIAS